MAIKSFRDLRVWQLSMNLVENVYRITGLFPMHEQYGLTSQMRRAAVSIPSNIAEGHTREHTNEYLHHLSFAQASPAELETQLELSRRLTYISQEQLDCMMSEMEPLAKQMRALRNSLNSRRNTATLSQSGM